MFQSGKGRGQDLAEFEDAREVIAGLSAEYAAFEQPGGELVGVLWHMLHLSDQLPAFALSSHTHWTDGAVST